MYIVASTSEQRALGALTSLGAEIAAQPTNETLRQQYLAQRQVLREHARSAAFITRMHRPPARRLVAIDAGALAETFAGISA